MLSALLTAALDMGLSKTTIREVAAHHGDEPEYITKLIQTFSLFYWLAYLFVVFFFILLLPWIISSWINLTTMDNEQAYYVLLVIGTTSLLAIPKTFMTSICVGLQRMDINNSIDISVAILQQLGIVLLLVEGNNVIVIAYWLAATNILRVMMYFAFISRVLSLKAMLPRFSVGVIRRIKEYATKMMWVSFLLVIHKQLDKVLISKLLPVGVLGIYGFAYSSIAKTTLVTGAVAQGVFPSFSELEKHGKKMESLNRFATLQDLLVFGTVPIFVFAVFATLPVFTFLLDAQKAQMLQLPVFFLCISFYLNATLRMMSTYVSAIGKAQYILNIEIFLLIVATPISVLLIISFGILGAAMSWVVYHIFAALYFVLKVYRIEFLQSPGIWFKSVMAAVGLMCLAYLPSWYAANVYYDGSIAYLLFFYIIGTVIYGISALNLLGTGLRKAILHYAPAAKALIIARANG